MQASSIELEHIAEIRSSGLFDEEFYLAARPDVRQANLDPLVHYVVFGRNEGQKPNSYFDAGSYRHAMMQDNTCVDLDPFIHFIRYNRYFKTFSTGTQAWAGLKLVNVAVEKLHNFPIFNGQSYKQQNDDVEKSEWTSAQHAILFGITEGRDIFTQHHVSEYFGMEVKNGIVPNAVQNTKEKKPISDVSIGIYYNTEGNSFIFDLCEDLYLFFQSMGLKVRLLSEKSSIQQRPQLCIFVAPHEYFFLGDGQKWRTPEIISHSIMVNTEQPQSLWFARAILYLLNCKGIIDLCAQCVPAYRHVSIPSIYFDPVISTKPKKVREKDVVFDLYRALPESAKQAQEVVRKIDCRSIDVSIFAQFSDKRDHFFSTTADFFSDYDCFFYYRKETNVIKEDVLRRMPGYVADNSKICLNIHRDHVNFFEWQRVVKNGISRGAIVVSEEMLPHPDFKPGEHFFVEGTKHIPHLIEWLLNSADGLSTMQSMQDRNLTLLNSTLKRTIQEQTMQAFLQEVVGAL